MGTDWLSAKKRSEPPPPPPGSSGEARRRGQKTRRCGMESLRRSECQEMRRLNPTCGLEPSEARLCALHLSICATRLRGTAETLARPSHRAPACEPRNCATTNSPAWSNMANPTSRVPFVQRRRPTPVKLRPPSIDTRTHHASHWLISPSSCAQSRSCMHQQDCQDLVAHDSCNCTAKRRFAASHFSVGPSERTRSTQYPRPLLPTSQADHSGTRRVAQDTHKRETHRDSWRAPLFGTRRSEAAQSHLNGRTVQYRDPPFAMQEPALAHLKLCSSPTFLCFPGAGSAAVLELARQNPRALIGAGLRLAMCRPHSVPREVGETYISRTLVPVAW